MGMCRLFASPHSTRPAGPLWRACLSFVALVCCVLLYGLPTPALGAQTHGCAPAVSPPVTGTIPLQAAPGSLLINELVSNPASNWNCSEPNRVYSAQNDSWVEFFNPQNQALDLYAAHAVLSLDGGSSFIYFTFGTAIAAHGFLVIFPRSHQTVGAATPWNVVLRVENTIVDQVQAPILQADQSYARIPDGSTTWLYSGHPTIDASNDTGQPITPTPGSTPTATGSPASGAVDQPVSSGTQPTWKKVQLPTDTTPAPAFTATVDPASSSFSQPQNPSSPPGSSPSGWLIALTVLFSLLLLAALAWCWRLFHAP